MLGLTEEETKSMSLIVSEKKVNKLHSVVIEAVPISYNVRINNDLIYCCNNLANARALQAVLLCDMAGVDYKDGI